MTDIKSTLRRLGVLKLIRAIVEKPIGVIGFTLVPNNQVTWRNWCGLTALPIRSILDIGGNRGEWAEMAAQVFPDANIHSFEPLPDVYRQLESIASSSSGRIKSHNYALGETSGTSKFEVSVNFPATSSMLSMTEQAETLFPATVEKETIEIDVRTLDEVATNLSPTLTDDLLIKMDVQGFEDRVIKGGMSVFANARAVLLEISIDTLYSGQAEFRTLFQLLDQLGLVFAGTYNQYCDPVTGRVIFLDAVFIRPTTK